MTQSKQQTQLLAYFDEEIARCQALEQRCSADFREDEAIFAKIQHNVWDIFRTMLMASEKAGEAGARQFFFAKLEQIPQNWRTALEQAQTHGDVEKAHIETTKLETVARIKAAAQRLWRDEI